jgi:flagellar FliL protein
MIKKLIPLLLALVGLGGGMGAGLALRPAPEPTEEAEPVELPPEQQPEFVKLNNQFVVPVLQDGRVAAMVIMSLSLEVVNGTTTQVYEREPKLRDVFLQVMFDHANAGGFRGSFTDAQNLILLRRALLEAAQSTLPDIVTDVLIVEIVRQDG